MTSALVLVSTPIGNLGDLSQRAIDELTAADLVCCEDTRRTGRLLSHLGISARLMRADEHTEHRAADEVIQHLQAGKRVVLVSDAGTPGVSDPGQHMVEMVLGAGLEVSSIPGPSAALAALVASGLSTARFVFEGFLERRGSARQKTLLDIAAQHRTVVLYESPNRTAATLRDLAEVCGPGRRAVVARELTKLHEEFIRGSLDQLIEWADRSIKGEVVILVEGAPPPAEPTDEEITEAIVAALAAGGSRRDAASEVAAALGVGRSRVYDLVLTSGDSTSSS